MSNILESTLVETKGNRIDRFDLASKIRFTKPTYLSLLENIAKDKIKTAIEKYNKVYDELRNAVVSAEVAAAENQARASAAKTKDSKALAEEEKRMSLIKEDEQVAKIASVGVAKRRFASLAIAVQKLSGKFGTLGKNFGVNVKPKYLPKALSVPKTYSKVYNQISKSVDLYNLADKVDVIDPSLVETQLENAKAPSNVPSWRKLFENVTPQQTADVTVAMNSQPLSRNSDEEELASMPEVQKGISAADLSHRTILANINDELVELEKLRSSANGFTSPFDSGLEERKQNLQSMLYSVSGIEGSLKKKKPVLERPNTDFQNLIEDIVGYSKPLTEEEYRNKEAELQSYYSDPEVGDTIEKLRHKDILYAFNEPDSYNRVMEAERKDNARIAEEATALEVIGEDPEQEEDIDDTILSLGAIEQAQELKQKQDEYDFLADGSLEEARRLVAVDETNNIIAGSVEQAQMLKEQYDENKFLAEGAKQQAQMLKTLNDFMKKQAEMEAENQQETAYVIQSASEQAQMLKEQYEENRFLAEGAKDEASRLVSLDAANASELTAGAKEQAQMLEAQYEENRFLAEGAKEEAQMLKEQYDENRFLTEGAKEQAQMLKAKYDENRFLALGSLEEASRLAANNSNVSLVHGAKKQNINGQNNEETYLATGAKEQAQEIIDAEEREQIIRGSEQQARNIIESSLERSKNGSEPEIIDVVGAMEDMVSQMAYHNASSDELLDGALQQAQLLKEQYDENRLLATGSLEEAKRLLNINEEKMLSTGAYLQAKMLKDRIDENRFLAAGAKEEAKSLFDKYVQSINRGSGIIDLSAHRCQLLKLNDRFCNLKSSRAIKVRPGQKQNIDKRMSAQNRYNSTARIKEELTSMRDQLSASDFDFLRFDENVVGHAKAA